MCDNVYCPVLLIVVVHSSCTDERNLFCLAERFGLRTRLKETQAKTAVNPATSTATEIDQDTSIKEIQVKQRQPQKVT